MHWKDGDVCVYPLKNQIPFSYRRRELEINKIFSSKQKSIGSNIYDLKNSVLHDRNKIGGNSEIWGGFFDTKDIQNLWRLQYEGIRMVPLSLEKTGSQSNIRTLVQLQDDNNKIINASNYLKKGIYKYLDSIDCDFDMIKLKFSGTNSKNDNKICKVQRVSLVTFLSSCFISTNLKSNFQNLFLLCNL